MRLEIGLALGALLHPDIAPPQISSPTATAPLAVIEPTPVTRSAGMTLDRTAPPPRGYVVFCQRRPAQCGGSAVEVATTDPTGDGASPPAAKVVLSYDWTGVFAAAASPPGPRPVSPRQMSAVPAALWKAITRVNASVNRAISPRNDIDAYGVADVWAMPLEEGSVFGDCEDYVLEKRRALLDAGVPARDLSIAVVSTFRGERHAVLLVETPAGEYVLDNRTPWVVSWTKTSYRWEERQVAGSARHWATVRPFSDQGPVRLARASHAQTGGS